MYQGKYSLLNEIKSWREAVYLEFAFGGLGVMTTQAS